MGVTTRFVPLGQARADAVIIGVFSSEDGPTIVPGGEWVAKQLGSKLTKALKSLGATGRAEEITKIPTLGLTDYELVIAVGLGAKPDHGLEPETVRRAIGAALRTHTTSKRVHIAIGRDLKVAAAAAEGALLGSYSYLHYKSNQEPTAISQVTVAVSGDKTVAAKNAQRRAKSLAESVWLARDLVNAPPNDLYPASLAKRLSDAATEAGATVEILDERALKRGGYGGILGVGGGSSRPPRLLRATYVGPKPRGAAALTKVALIGKGITFDSGGLNLKPGVGLSWMKCDMGGAAAAVAAVIAAAQLRLPIEVTATVALAENMISGTSYRPSDVLTLRSGKTLEITNTDAEGRVVLADAITRACEDKPDYLIEASTLTGAQIVALGTRIIAAMGSEGLRDRVVAAGNAAGESLWGMPLPEELRAGLDSPVADMVNLPSQPVGGMLFAGIFLGEFVTEDIPWVHLDIAGPAYNQGGPWGYTPKGGTGAAVRTLLSSLEMLASEG